MSGTDSGDGSPLSPSKPNGKPTPSGGFTGDAVRSFLWAFGGFGGSRLVVFITTLVLVRILSPDDFGTVAAALVLLEFINLVLALGLGASLVQEQATGHGIRVDSAFTMQMVSAITATALLMLASPALASMLGIEGEADVLRGVALAIVIRAAGQIHDALIQRELRFKTRTVVDVSRSLVRLVVSVVLALEGAGAWALVIGMLASELTATVALWLLVPYRPRLRIGPAHLISLLRFGGAVTGIRICSAVIASTDYLVIGGQLGPTALGFYVIAFRLPELLIENVLTVFSQVAFPVLSRARSMSQALMRDAVMRSLKLVTLFGFATGTGLAIVANDAVNVFFGPEWQSSVAPMVILSLAVGVGSLGYGVGDAYLAFGRPMTRLWILVILMIPTVVAFIVVAPWGIVAVAWVHLAFASVDSSCQLALSRKIVGLSWRGLMDTLRGPIGATVGVMVTALPVALVTPTSAVALVATVCAGVAGATVGAVGADRSIPALVMDLVGTIRTRPV